MTAPAISMTNTSETDWHRLRNCSLEMAHLFDEDEDGNYPHADEAKAVCAGCPVRFQCLETAMENYEYQGIWGGMLPAERLRYQRFHRRQKRGGKGRVRNPNLAQHSAEARYSARLAKARAVRQKLMALPHDYTLRLEKVGTYTRDDFLQVVDMVIANPMTDAATLGARLHHSQAWFNNLLHGISKELGVTA